MDIQLKFPDSPSDELRATTGARLLFTVSDAAAMLSIGRSTVYELIAAGQLEVIHIGRSARVPMDAIEDLVTRLRAQARPRGGRAR